MDIEDIINREQSFLDDIPALPSFEMTEHEFRPFLSMFAYREEPSKTPIPVWEWVELVGSGFGWVDVYERRTREGTFENLLFKVPPIFKQTDRLDKIPSGIHLPSVIETAVEHGRIKEKLGDNYLYDSFIRHLPDVKDIEPDWTIPLAWNKIFKRYGMKLIPIDLPRAVRTQTGHSNEQQPKRVQKSEY